MQESERHALESRAASGEPSDRAAWLRVRMEEGLDKERVLLAAHLGDLGARLAAGHPACPLCDGRGSIPGALSGQPGEERACPFNGLDLDTWMQVFAGFDTELQRRVVGQVLLPSLTWQGPAMRRAIETWIESPSPLTQAAIRASVVMEHELLEPFLQRFEAGDWTEMVRRAFESHSFSILRPVLELELIPSLLGKPEPAADDGAIDLEELARRAAADTEAELVRANAALVDPYDALREHLEGADFDDTEPVYVLRPLEHRRRKTPWNRIGGTPPGIGSKRWPRFQGQPMVHVLTVDLRSLPVLAARFRDAATVSLFLSDAMDNEAFAPHTEESAVVFSSLEQAERRTRPPKGAPRLEESGGFDVVEVQVPRDIWQQEEDPLFQLLYQQCARAAGPPQWLQTEEHLGNFLLQFDTAFIDINLGDMGVLYLFEDTAFWQCH